MRRPSDQEALHFWWNCALQGLPVAYHEGNPECGYYKVREKIAYREYGPWLPVHIWIESPVDSNGNLSGDEQMLATKDGIHVAPDDIWTWCCRYPVSEEEYQMLQWERLEAKGVA